MFPDIIIVIVNVSYLTYVGNNKGPGMAYVAQSHVKQQENLHLIDSKRKQSKSVPSVCKKSID